MNIKIKNYITNDALRSYSPLCQDFDAQGVYPYCGWFLIFNLEDETLIRLSEGINTDEE